MAKQTYFAAREGKEAASVLLDKATDWKNTLTTNGYLEKLKPSSSFFLRQAGHRGKKGLVKSCVTVSLKVQSHQIL
jgi:hypothetical protein